MAKKMKSGDDKYAEKDEKYDKKMLKKDEKSMKTAGIAIALKNSQKAAPKKPKVKPQKKY